MITIEDSIKIGEFSVYIDTLTGEFFCNEYSYGENKHLVKVLTDKFKGEVMDKVSLKNVLCYVEGYHDGRS